MKAEGKNLQNGSFFKEKSLSGSQTQKTSAQVGKDLLNSPKKHIYYQKAKQSQSHIEVSSRQNDSTRTNKNNDSILQEKKQKKQGFEKNDKRCIQPTEKIIDRINKNLRLLEGKIEHLFSFNPKEQKQEKKHQEVRNTKLFGESLLIKKNGSTLSLTKNNSKKRLEGRLTHDGMRSDRKNTQMDRSSKISQQPGWK